MDKKLTHLIHQLKGKSHPDSMRFEFQQLGDEAFDEIFAHIQDDSFTTNQICNGLHILFDLISQACQNKKKPLFVLLKDCCRHPEGKVRAVAAKLLIGMVRMSESAPDLYQLDIASRKDVFDTLNYVVDNGLDGQTLEYVNGFIGSDIL